MQRCNRCFGAKTVLGMGGMRQDCPLCDGTGTIDILIDATSNHTSGIYDKLEDEPQPIIKRRGRKPNVPQRYIDPLNLV